MQLRGAESALFISCLKYLDDVIGRMVRLCAWPVCIFRRRGDMYARALIRSGSGVLTIVVVRQ